MQRIVLVIILLSGMFILSAQDTTIPLYDPPAPGNKDVMVEEEKTLPRYACYQAQTIRVFY